MTLETQTTETGGPRMTVTILLLMTLLQAGASAQSFEELFALGLRLSNERRWQEAEQAFRRAAELEPRAPAPHVELGRIHLRRDEPVRAIAALDEALRRSRGDFTALYLRGRALLQLRHYAEATLEFEAALARRPDDEACRTGLAEAALGAGEPARAVGALAPVIDGSSDGMLHALHGLALAELGQYDDSRAALERARQLGLDTGGLIQVARAELAMGRFEEAASSFRLGSDLSGPISVEFTLGLAEAEMARGDVAQARRLLEPLLVLDPHLKRGWFLIGLVEEVEGDHAAAAKAFNECVEMGNDTVLVNLKLGAAQAKAGDRASAWTAFARALELDPTQAETHYQMGRLLSEEKRFRESIPFFEQAARLEPDETRSALALSEVYLELDRYEAAIEAANRAADASSTAARAHYVKALANYAVREFPAAEAACREAMAHGLRSAGLYFSWGLSLAAMNRFPEAREAMAEALRQDPGFAEAHVESAKVSTQLRDYEVAMEHLSRAMELSPDDAEVWYQMGVVEARRGHIPRAIELWRKALVLNPEMTRLYYRLGTELVRAGRVDEGEKLLAKFQTRSAADEAEEQRAVRAENVLRRAMALSDQRRDEEALHLFDEAVEADSGNPLPYVALAEFHLSRGREGEAENTLRQGVAKNPESIRMHELLLSLYETTGKASGAEATRKRLEELRSNRR